MKIEINKTGVVRRIDDLGRIVIPKEYRRKIDIHAGDPLEICLFDGGIALLKHDESANKEKIAKKFLDENKDLFKKYYARFTIDGSSTVTCECIRFNMRKIGVAKCSPEDTFSVYIGMVYAFCRAAKVELPENF